MRAGRCDTNWTCRGPRSELVLEPRKQYKRLHKLAYAVEKLLCVTTTVPHARNPPERPTVASLGAVNDPHLAANGEGPSANGGIKGIRSSPRKVRLCPVRAHFSSRSPQKTAQPCAGGPFTAFSCVTRRSLPTTTWGWRESLSRRPTRWTSGLIGTNFCSRPPSVPAASPLRHPHAAARPPVTCLRPRAHQGESRVARTSALRAVDCPDSGRSAAPAGI